MENVNFELYKVFYYVVKHKNLTRAAKELFISQPAITQSIKKLEEQIGYTLFYRTKHGMNLTKEGEILFEYLKTPIECFQNGKNKIKEIHEEKNKILRLGGGTTVLQHNLLGPLQKFRQKYPQIQFIIKHDMSKKLLEMLINDQLDLIILTSLIPNSEDILFIPIEEMHDQFVASTKEFGQYQNKIFSMKDINTLPLILQEKSSSTRAFLDGIALNEKIVLNATYELVSYGLVLEFVKTGLGIGFINTNRIKKELHSKKLFQLKTNFQIPSRHIYVAIHKKNANNEMIQGLIKYLKKEA